MAATIPQLIPEARRRGERGERAAARLAMEGAPAVMPILDILPTLPADLKLRFSRIALRIRDPDALPHLRRYVHDKDPLVALTAIAAIGRSIHPSALDVLSDLLTDCIHRDRVVDAIGELRDPRGLDVLRWQSGRFLKSADDSSELPGLIRLARRDGDVGNLLSLISIAVARGKHGDQQLCGVISELSRYGRGEANPDGDAMTVRVASTLALAHLVGSGAFRALADSLHDENDEVRRYAMRALLLIGSKEAVRYWMEIARKQNSDSALAHSMIHELTGQWPDGCELVETVNPLRLDSWWQAFEPNFNPSVSYRFGRPASISDIFPLIESGANDELRIITGVDFQLDTDLRLISDAVPDAAAATAARWWKVAESSFPPGGLYKYGRRCRIEEAFKE